MTTVVCLCACLSISLSSTPVSAATWKNKVVNDSKGFKKAWEKTVTYKLDNKNVQIWGQTPTLSIFLS